MVTLNRLVSSFYAKLSQLTLACVNVVSIKLHQTDEIKWRYILKKRQIEPMMTLYLKKLSSQK